MNTRKMAEDYIARAKTFLREARETYAEGDYALTVRRAQECVELSLKAVLRHMGIEYPSRHDVSPALDVLMEGRTLPDWFKVEVDYLKAKSLELSQLRGLAMYGDEATFTPASHLFTQETAKDSLESAQKIFTLCHKLLSLDSSATV